MLDYIVPRGFLEVNGSDLKVLAYSHDLAVTLMCLWQEVMAMFRHERENVVRYFAPQVAL